MPDQMADGDGSGALGRMLTMTDKERADALARMLITLFRETGWLLETIRAVTWWTKLDQEGQQLISEAMERVPTLEALSRLVDTGEFRCNSCVQRDRLELLVHNISGLLEEPLPEGVGMDYPTRILDMIADYEEGQRG